jgi:aryl-alcohol dehydrogenase-like predicted oxidoreductase
LDRDSAHPSGFTDAQSIRSAGNQEHQFSVVLVNGGTFSEDRLEAALNNATEVHVIIDKGLGVKAAELGIGIVPYSPLRRGFLTGTVTSSEKILRGPQHPDQTRFPERTLRTPAP